MKILVPFLLLIPFFGASQLPKPQILAENGVKSVEIWRFREEPLVEGRTTFDVRKQVSEIKKNNPDKENTETWFFNKQGYPDSCWRYGYEEKRTYMFGFDAEKRLNFFQANLNNRMENKSKIIRHTNGEMDCMIWDKKSHDWTWSYSLSADSLFIRSGVVSDSTAYYSDDRTTGIIARTRYEDGKLMHRYAERWTTTSDGKPDSLIITFEQHEELPPNSFKGKSSVQGFKLNEDGSVIPNNDRNPYRLNYFTRGNKKKPFSEHMIHGDVVKSVLRGNELIEKSQVFVERTFGNVHPRHHIEYRYEFY